MNVQRRAENARCDTFSTPIKRYSEGEPLTLGDTLQSGAQDDPERVALARELGHPYSLAYALTFSAILHCRLRQPTQALELAAERICAYHIRQKPADDRYEDETGVSLGHRWTPIASAAVIRFRREIRLFQRFDLETSKIQLDPRARTEPMEAAADFWIAVETLGAVRACKP